MNTREIKKICEFSTHEYREEEVSCRELNVSAYRHNFGALILPAVLTGVLGLDKLKHRKVQWPVHVRVWACGRSWG